MIHYFQNFYFLLSLFLLGYLVIAIAKYNRNTREYTKDCTVVYKPKQMDTDIVEQSDYMFSELDPFMKRFETDLSPKQRIVNQDHEDIIQNMTNDIHVVTNKKLD